MAWLPCSKAAAADASRRSRCGGSRYFDMMARTGGMVRGGAASMDGARPRGTAFFYRALGFGALRARRRRARWAGSSAMAGISAAAGRTLGFANTATGRFARRRQQKFPKAAKHRDSREIITAGYGGRWDRTPPTPHAPCCSALTPHYPGLWTEAYNVVPNRAPKLAYTNARKTLTHHRRAEAGGGVAPCTLLGVAAPSTGRAPQSAV